MSGTRRLVSALIIAVIGATLWWRFGRGIEIAVVVPTRGTAVEIVYATGAVEPVRWPR
jgi:hypothetical protein